MAFARTSEPVAEPVTLAQAKAHLRVDVPDDDQYIGTLISVVRTAAEDRLQRTLVHTGWRLTLDKFPLAIRLPMPPLASVQSVQYRNADAQWTTLSSQDYQVDTANEPGFLVPAAGKNWPDVGEGINGVLVNYTAGYGATGANVPMPIRHWLLLALSDLYHHRNRSSDKPAVPQDFADGLLDTYKMWGV